MFRPEPVRRGSIGASLKSTHYNRLMRSWDLFSGARPELSTGAPSMSTLSNQLMRLLGSDTSN
jgi:hypothetical protein